MISTREAPLSFFEYLLTNLEEFVEERFYTNYQNQLDQVNIDRDAKTIVYWLREDNGEDTKHIENEALFLKQQCYQEFRKSIRLIEEQVNKQVSLVGNADVFLALTENKLVDLFEQSINFKKFDIKYFIQLLILDFKKKYTRIYKTNTQFISIAKLLTSGPSPTLKNKRVLSFQWVKEPKKLEDLFEALSLYQPPFIASEKETFLKAFTKRELLSDEGINWVCFQERNKKQPSYVSLYRFTELLFDNGFLLMEDYIDINKILEHIFLSPKGETIKGKMKSAKRVKSKIPARFNDLEEIVNKLLL